MQRMRVITMTGVAVIGITIAIAKYHTEQKPIKQIQKSNNKWEHKSDGWMHKSDGWIDIKDDHFNMEESSVSGYKTGKYAEKSKNDIKNE